MRGVRLGWGGSLWGHFEAGFGVIYSHFGGILMWGFIGGWLFVLMEWDFGGGV